MKNTSVTPVSASATEFIATLDLTSSFEDTITQQLRNGLSLQNSINDTLEVLFHAESKLVNDYKATHGIIGTKKEAYRIMIKEFKDTYATILSHDEFKTLEKTTLKLFECFSILFKYSDLIIDMNSSIRDTTQNKKDFLLALDKSQKSTTKDKITTFQNVSFENYLLNDYSKPLFSLSDIKALNQEKSGSEFVYFLVDVTTKLNEGIKKNNDLIKEDKLEKFEAKQKAENNSNLLKTMVKSGIEESIAQGIINQVA